MAQTFRIAAPSVGAIIGTQCATRQDAEVLLSDRAANGDAFPGEHVVSVAVPVIHVNGTPRQHLLVLLEAAVAALFMAREKVSATSPNARDYYMQGDDSFGQAVKEHDSRLRRLLSVEQELQQIAEAIQG